ncbi:TPA: hypothetical protein M2O83_004149 [Klebsiella pneumoniae]|nr:hypothetical protein [Klebsiella pneumoniae]HDK6181721.1 hypothetical protein [Klebsiella pneumoniae]
MYIAKVMSYKNAWERINEKYTPELNEILTGLNDLFPKNTPSPNMPDRITPREVWDGIMYAKDWQLSSNVVYSPEGTRININRLGPIKNGVSVTNPFGVFDTFSRWLFQQSTVAIKYGLIEIPVMIIPIREFSRQADIMWLRRETFETNLAQLEMLTPLSHPYPFLIIGYSNKKPKNGPEIIELLHDSYVKDDKPVIDRCIEFPPEYHQAGLDILNYFGTYLREQYPDENASVKIEQKGLNVRLIIETSDGKSEVIEKALHEYELIITGAEPPEKFSKNDKLVLELRNELRIAKFRIESQQDMIGIQNHRIEQLFSLIGKSISQKNNVMVDFKPTVTVSNNISINQIVAEALGSVNELIEEIPESNEAYFVLKELEGSLITIETNNDQESVRRSPAMSKFRRLIDKVTEAGSNLNQAIEKADKGWEIFSDLASRYNKLAEWCGLPVVPSILIK